MKGYKLFYNKPFSSHEEAMEFIKHKGLGTYYFDTELVEIDSKFKSENATL